MICIACKNWGKCEAMEERWAIHSLGLNGFGCDFEEPTFITPAQYEKRTGRDYPDNAPVWMWYQSDWPGDRKPYLQRYITAREMGGVWFCCAFGDFVPPDDWRPE